MAIGTLGYTLCLYAIPKGLTSLCTPVENADSRWDRLRTQMSEIQKWVERKVGPRAWFFATDVISDNAWISYFVLAYLSKWNIPAKFLVTPFETGFAFFTLSAAALAARYAIGKQWPELRPYIATRTGEAYGV
jgi:hypothetical protein